MAKLTRDVLVVGGGHNGLVAATLLARSGLSVLVAEQSEQLGGAVRTEYPFERAPELGVSSGAYLLGLMPPKLLRLLDLQLPLLRRDPHYFLPTSGERYLLLGSGQARSRQQLARFFCEQDWRAHEALQAELGDLREDIAPSWLAEPLSIEETAERYVRPPLREVFVQLCRGSIRTYLDRFGFRSDLIKAMYAVTDAFTGVFGAWDTPGTGMNFLIHNMCRLPASGGTWMLVRGGMGVLTAQLARLARELGAEIWTSRRVVSLRMAQGVCRGAVLADGSEVTASAVVVNADPFRLRQLAGAASFPAAYNQRLDAYARPGSSLKVNLALRGLPEFSCLKEDLGQHRGTIHLLADESEVIAALDKAFQQARAGELPEQPAMELYIHTALDSSLKDSKGRHSAALFVQWVPYALKASSWEVQEQPYVQHLLSLWERLAPGSAGLVDDVFTLTPPKIEQRFGMTGGHIHHIDNTFGFADRLPYTTPVEGLYSASAGCHPGGSVIGAAGHNAAARLLRDLGKG